MIRSYVVFVLRHHKCNSFSTEVVQLSQISRRSWLFAGRLFGSLSDQKCSSASPSDNGHVTFNHHRSLGQENCEIAVSCYLIWHASDSFELFLATKSDCLKKEVKKVITFDSDIICQKDWRPVVQRGQLGLIRKCAENKKTFKVHLKNFSTQFWKLWQKDEWHKIKLVFKTHGEVIYIFSYTSKGKLTEDKAEKVCGFIIAVKFHRRSMTKFHINR